MSDPTHRVVFAHGKESGPWGSKIRALANVAKTQDYAVESPDYTATFDPKVRLAQLLQHAPQAQRLVLVGSSMGAYVSAMACTKLQPCALFLMAPALYFDEYPDEPANCPADTVVVHGWHDQVVPVARAWQFAQPRNAELHLVNDGHRLNQSIEFLCALFARQLARVKAA